MRTVIRIMILVTLVTGSQAQVITTIAGTGVFGYSGDGGPATAAMIMYPWHIAVDGAGNVYFTDNFGNRIRKIDAAGNITTVAGTGLTGYTGDGGPATAASLYGPTGIAIDNAGNIYFASYSSIRRINTSGIIETIAGSIVAGYAGDGGPASAAQFNRPYGIALDAAGNLYIADVMNARIRKINLATDGFIHTVAGTGVAGYSGDGGPATAAQLRAPGDVRITQDGTLYITEGGGNRIRKVSPAGVITTIAGDGTLGFSGDGGPATAAIVRGPFATSINFDGTLYISDHDNSRIRAIGPGDTIVTIAGTGALGFSGDGGPATAADINGPGGITADALGNIFIADWGNSRIRRISTFNRAPWFIHGTIEYLTACGEFNFIDTLLQVMDTNRAQSISWSVASPPAHGAAIVSYSVTSTGGVLIPAGTGYTSSAGYAGPDTFRVRVFDGAVADTIIIAVDVQVFPVAAPITGADTICVGDTAILAAATPGGTWSSTAAAVAVVSGSAVVGITPGTATISYTVANHCGTDMATHVVTVLPEGECPTGINTLHIAGSEALQLWPSPASGSVSILLSSPVSETATVLITNVVGQEVKKLNIALNKRIEFELNVPPGVYTVSAITSRGRLVQQLVAR